MSKIDSFNDLLAKGRDIAVTHSTFLNATSETVELIHQGEYILILDEALDVVVDFNDVASVGNSVEQILKSKDIEVLIRDKLISVADNGLVTWIGGDYSGTKFSEVERLAKLNRLYCVNGSMMVCVFPPEVFRAFKEVYVMTYLLEGTFIKYYFDIFGIQYEKRAICKEDDNYVLTDYSIDLDLGFRQRCKELVKVCDEKRLNAGYRRTAFSKSWFDRAMNQDGVIRRLRTDMRYFFEIYAGAKSKDNLWTCPEAHKTKVQGKGYTCVRQMTKDEKNYPPEKRAEKEKELACFISLNARSTNDYKDRWALAYCYNMYMSPKMAHFFNNCGFPVNEELFAIACFIQWLFRSRIRDGENVVIYIPSSRMRDLFNSWLNGDL